CNPTGQFRALAPRLVPAAFGPLGADEDIDVFRPLVAMARNLGAGGVAEQRARARVGRAPQPVDLDARSEMAPGELGAEGERAELIEGEGEAIHSSAGQRLEERRGLR